MNQGVSDTYIILGKYDEFGPGMGFPSIKEYLQDIPCENKGVIVKYLKNGNIHMVTASRIVDIFTGENANMELVYMDDGKYSWSSKVTYYVEKYNLKLPEEFEKHVLMRLKSEMDSSKLKTTDVTGELGRYVN